MLNRYGLKEAAEDRLSDAGLKKMLPLFVKGRPGYDDHKCGGCSMFIPPDESTLGRCTIVKSGIDGANGTCNYWAPSQGKNATTDKIHPTQMTKETAGYVVVPAGMKVNCRSCFAFSPSNYCRLWDGQVAAEDCCMAWDNSRAVTPRD